MKQIQKVKLSVLVLRKCTRFDAKLTISIANCAHLHLVRVFSWFSRIVILLVLKGIVSFR